MGGQAKRYVQSSPCPLQAAHVSDYCDDLEEQEGRWRDAQATAAVYHDVRNALAANTVSPADAEVCARHCFQLGISTAVQWKT